MEANEVEPEMEEDHFIEFNAGAGKCGPDLTFSFSGQKVFDPEMGLI